MLSLQMRKLGPIDYKETCRPAARSHPQSPLCFTSSDILLILLRLAPAATQKRAATTGRRSVQSRSALAGVGRDRGRAPGGRARAGFSARARAGLAAPECAACGGGAAAIRRRSRAAWRGGLLHSGLLSPRAVFPELPRCRRWGDFLPTPARRAAAASVRPRLFLSRTQGPSGSRRQPCCSVEEWDPLGHEACAEPLRPGRGAGPALHLRESDGVPGKLSGEPVGRELLEHQRPASQRRTSQGPSGPPVPRDAVTPCSTPAVPGNTDLIQRPAGCPFASRQALSAANRVLQALEKTC